MIQIFFLIGLCSIYLIADDCRDKHFKFGAPAYKNSSITEICYDSHIIGFNTETKTAQWVEYHINKNMIVPLLKANVDYPRKLFSYKLDDSISNSYQIQPKEYEGVENIHKGHLAPYRNVGVNEYDKINVNRMSNIIPQSAGLNQGCWKQYENNIRKRAENGESLTVTLGVIYENLETISGLLIPSHLFMFIINENTKETQIAYFRNIKYDKNSCFDIKIVGKNEKSIEEKMGIDFYPNK